MITIPGTGDHDRRNTQPPRPASVVREWWRSSARGLDPFAGVADLVERTRAWFPAAWEEGGDSLPASPRFQHAWAGLLMLADWIGSDSERFFPFSEKGAATEWRGPANARPKPSTGLGSKRPRTRHRTRGNGRKRQWSRDGRIEGKSRSCES